MEKIKKYYVYELIDPRDNKVFYVGKGEGNRMYSHIKKVKNNIIPNHNNIALFKRIKNIISEGFDDIYYNKILETDDSNIAYDFEEETIKKYGLNNLCNIMLGKWGHLNSDIVEKIKQKNIGQKRTIESKQKMSSAAKGKILSGETKQKISEGLKGIKRNKFSDEHIEKMKNAWIKRKEEGRINLNKKREPLTEEQKQKLSKINKGKKRTEEQKRKMSEAAKNRKYSAEGLKKISESMKNRYKNGDGLNKKGQVEK